MIQILSVSVFTCYTFDNTNMTEAFKKEWLLYFCIFILNRANVCLGSGGGVLGAWYGKHIPEEQNSIKKTPLKTHFFYYPENLKKKASLIFY